MIAPTVPWLVQGFGTFVAPSVGTGGVGLIDSNQTRWVIPHRSEGVLVIRQTADSFIITTR